LAATGADDPAFQIFDPAPAGTSFLNISQGRAPARSPDGRLVAWSRRSGRGVLGGRRL